MMEKTNAMRILDSAGIAYTPHGYDQNLTDGEQVAAALGKAPETVFKTLVTVASDGRRLVFVIPVRDTLNLKKAARAASVKNVEMIKQKELLPLTGYVHGGCSPIGMKKPFATFIDSSALSLETMTLNAGKRGYQIELSPEKLAALVGGGFADLTG